MQARGEEMVINRFKWKCPDCSTEQTDEIDSYVGPFITCTCGSCGASFSQSEVKPVYLGPPPAEHVLYDCGICGALHPWAWRGDCRDNENRFNNAEDYALAHGIDMDAVEIVVRSMEERVEADCTP
jgi:hypothetical protein